MIRALFNLNVINGAEAEKLYRLANSSTKIIKYLNEKDPDYFLSDRAEELDKYIEAESDNLIEFALKNNTLTGKGEGFTKQEVEQIKAVDPDALADKLSDEIGADIDEVMLVKGLMNRVLNDIKQNLGDEGFDISDQARIGDHKWYITDNTHLLNQFDWKPSISLKNIISDILSDS